MLVCGPVPDFIAVCRIGVCLAVCGRCDTDADASIGLRLVVIFRVFINRLSCVQGCGIGKEACSVQVIDQESVTLINAFAAGRSVSFFPQ